MKPYYWIFIFVVLLGCEDSHEDIYRYSKIITQTKGYPVFLDMTKAGNIHVDASVSLTKPFKIVSNDYYYFVGDMLKGIHVYKKNAGSVSYSCFIDCRYIKDFDVAGNLLYCNNFLDLIILDVSNPLQLNILHREINYFNRFKSYVEYWNVQYVEGKGPVVGTETHELTGTVTEKKPDLDFTEYDKLYGNLMVDEVPGTWFSDHPEYDKPYLGILKMGAGQIYTWGSYNSWFICNFSSGSFNTREEDVWTTPLGKYAPPYYYSDAWPGRMFLADSLVYILGKNYNSGYADCILYNENYPMSIHLFFPTFIPVGVTFMPDLREFLVLSGQSIWGAFRSPDETSGYIEKYVDYDIPTAASSIFRTGNNVITLGDTLSVFLPSENELTLVKSYPDISGTCYLKEGDVIAVADTRGLFLYDISDLENITLIP